MDMTSNPRKMRPGYAQCFATSPSALGTFLAARGMDPATLAGSSSRERACLIAAAGNLLGWAPEVVLERLREWVPDANAILETTPLAALGRDRLLLGLHGEIQTEVTVQPVPSLVTATEWASLCHAARNRSQATAVAARPLTFVLECCGFVYRCPCPVDDARCCSRCRPLFARSVRLYAPHEYVIDDIIRAGVSELLDQMAAQSNSGLSSLAGSLNQGVQASVVAAANRIVMALPSLPPALQSDFVSKVEQLRLPPGDTRERVVGLRRQAVERFPEAISAARSGQGFAFLKLLLAICSSLVTIERADDCPTVDRLTNRVQHIIELIDSGQLATRSVAALIRSSQSLPAVEVPDSKALKTVIALSRGPLLKLLYPALAPLAQGRADQQVAHAFLVLDGAKFDRDFDSRIASCPSPRSGSRAIAVCLGCSTARVQHVFDRLRQPAGTEPSSAPKSAGRRKALAPEEQARKEAEQARKEAEKACKEADRAAKARHSEEARAAKAAVNRLAMLVTRFRDKQSLDFREAREFLNPGELGPPDMAALPLARTTTLLLPQPTLETFDEQANLSDAAIPSTGDWCWQQGLQEVHFGAPRVACGPDDERAIREAKRYLYQLNRGLAGELTTHNQAYRIRLTARQRIVVEAQLLARESLEVIDESWQFPSGTARLYRDLFFNHGRSPDIAGAGGWSRFVALGDDGLGALECYLKRTALMGGAKLSAAIGHLQRVQGMLIPLPGPPIPITDAEFIEAEFRWVHHCHPVLPPALDAVFLKRLDAFRLLLRSASPRSRRRKAGTKSRARPRGPGSGPDLFGESVASTHSSAPQAKDSQSRVQVGEVDVPLAWPPEVDATFADFEVLSAGGSTF